MKITSSNETVSGAIDRLNLIYVKAYQEVKVEEAMAARNVNRNSAGIADDSIVV